MADFKVADFGAGVCTDVIDITSNEAGNIVSDDSTISKVPASCGKKLNPYPGPLRRGCRDMYPRMVGSRRQRPTATRGYRRQRGEGVASANLEAGHAAQSPGQMGLGGWRIFRILTDLLVTTLVEGTLKGVTGAEEGIWVVVSEYHHRLSAGKRNVV